MKKRRVKVNRRKGQLMKGMDDCKEKSRGTDSRKERRMKRALREIMKAEKRKKRVK